MHRGLGLRKWWWRFAHGWAPAMLLTLGPVGCGREAPPRPAGNHFDAAVLSSGREGDGERPAVVVEPGETPVGMAWVPGGVFGMGTGEAYPDERPVHEVRVSGFWMDRTEVTNEQFGEFVKASGYVTVAERKPDAGAFPGSDAEFLVAGSLVFTPPEAGREVRYAAALWRFVPGANWRHPEGPDSTIGERRDHPVVQVCWHDAVAYGEWAGKRLPTEGEWEFAARGGLEGKRYPWGNERNPEGKWLNNIWQGRFPYENSGEDGYEGTAPVGSFGANEFGLSEMSGNVWEWCADLYLPDYYERSACCDPVGPAVGFDPAQPGVEVRVQRGGSFLCSDDYCVRYKVSSRMRSPPDTATNHVGFRCVMSPVGPTRSSGP